jgi:hypothetical protein
MTIINVIEVMEDNNLNVESFPIYEEQLERDVVEKAEELFSQKAKENGAKEEDIESYIEDGYYEPVFQPSSNYRLFLIWSNVN